MALWIKEKSLSFTTNALAVSFLSGSYRGANSMGAMMIIGRWNWVPHVQRSPPIFNIIIIIIIIIIIMVIIIIIIIIITMIRLPLRGWKNPQTNWGFVRWGTLPISWWAFPATQLMVNRRKVDRWHFSVKLRWWSSWCLPSNVYRYAGRTYQRCRLDHFPGKKMWF